jgi:hypothetical protein
MYREIEEALVLQRDSASKLTGREKKMEFLSNKQNSEAFRRKKQAETLIILTNKQLEDLKLYNSKASKTWSALEDLEIFKGKSSVTSDDEPARLIRSKMEAYQWFHKWLTGEQSSLRFDMLSKETGQQELNLEVLQLTLLLGPSQHSLTDDVYSEFADLYERVVKAKKSPLPHALPTNIACNLPIRPHSAAQAERKKLKSPFRRLMQDMARFKSPNLEKDEYKSIENGLHTFERQGEPKIAKDEIRVWMKDVPEQSSTSINASSIKDTIVEAPSDADNGSSSHSRFPPSTNAFGSSSFSTNPSSVSRNNGKRREGQNKDNDDNSDDEDEGRKNWRPERQNNSRSKLGSRRLSCPYYKRNPLLHRNFRACVHPGFEDTARLK